MKGVLVAILALTVVSGSFADESLTGTNAPGGATLFRFSVGAGTTNLSLVVSNSVESFSHLLLKRGGDPTETDFDFSSRFDGTNNAIDLESPECAIANYGLLVRTPVASSNHLFAVTLTTNASGMRSMERPVHKPQAFTAGGSLAAGQWHYFRVEIPADSPGWRLVLNSTSATPPSLYLRKDGPPTASDYEKALTGQTNGTMFLTEGEAVAGSYFLGVYQPDGAADYTLFSEVGYLTTLNWDPGETHAGTEVFTNVSLSGGDYYFRIDAQDTDIGVWRTALNVQEGEADLYMQNGWQPGEGSPWRSRRVGSDGFVLHASQYGVGEEWFMVVHASPGAKWNLMSGRAFVTDLGVLSADESSGSGPVSIGAEGMRFFKTTAPADTLAWRLWLNGLNRTLYVKKSFAPHPASFDLAQSRQMLVVPDYLGGGSFNGYYFVGVAGTPGETIDLDSRRQAVTDVEFSSATAGGVTGYGYTTYRVQVPVEQIAWQAKVAASSGEANIAIRREKVPNEWNNDAFSEAPGATIDSVTLVPPTLSDGTFYVTVYGVGPHTFTLTSGNPVVTDIAFTGSTANDDPGRAGWRYYRIADIPSQLGHLGWDLFLENHVPGTEIALRRNAVPGRWSYRQNNDPYVYTSSGHLDFSGIEFLQRPNHQADVWYVGVYKPAASLGNFTLVTRPLTATAVSFDGLATNIAGQPPNKWQFLRIDVPANALGWDVRVRDVTSGDPRIVVRRDLLPESLNGGPEWNGFSYGPWSCTNWPSGWQWARLWGGSWYWQPDFTRRTYDGSGEHDESGRILTMGMGNPLEPGTYYVGVLNGSDAGEGTNAMSYTLASRGIGEGMTIPVVDVPFAGGSASASGVAPRESVFYRVVVPEGTASWQLRLRTTDGESSLQVKREAVPTVNNGDVWYQSPYDAGAKSMRKTGDEQWVLLPENGTNAIRAGAYYLAAVSEGRNPTNSESIGTGSSSWTIESLGTVPVPDLGTVGETDLVQADTLAAGAMRAYHFEVPAGVVSVEVRLEDKTGNPLVATIAGEGLPTVRGASPSWNGYPIYGNWGGQWPTLYDRNICTLVNPTAGTYSVSVFADSLDPWANEWTNTTYTLRVRNVYPPPVAFDGGSSAVTGQEPGHWRFFRVDVPANALGWDVRVRDVTSGDPRIVVRRDLLPESLNGGPEWNGFSGGPWNCTNWPSGWQWARWWGGGWYWQPDFTGRPYDESGMHDESGRILTMGMGNPLEPGTYYVGVLNASGSSEETNAMSYTLVSRGIGEGMTIPVVDVPFAGGSASASNMVARESAIYRVVVPEDTPSWQLRLRTTEGEASLQVKRDAVPAVNNGDVWYRSPYDPGAKPVRKAGDEQWVLLPENGTNVIRAGVYYLAAVSEGRNPTNSESIGTGSSSWTIESSGAVPVPDLGTVGESDLVQADTLAAGALRAYRFEVPAGAVSVEVRLEGKTGNPLLAVIAGEGLPTVRTGPPSWSGYPIYGNWGGQLPTLYDRNICTLVNPTAGTYSVSVFADSQDWSGTAWTNATYTLRVLSVYPPPVAFDGGSSTVTGQEPGHWRFFRVDVPANALGWDVRVRDVTSGDPRIVVRRDLLPESLNGGPEWNGFSYGPWNCTNWPSGWQWARWLGSGTWYWQSDFTGRAYDESGEHDESGRILTMGMGNPLEPGTYYVGVLNGSGSSEETNAMSYTLVSRGIGEGMTIPVVDVPFAGGSASASNVAAREAAFYRVVVPEDTPSWQLRLTTTEGEASLQVKREAVPAVNNGDGWSRSPYDPGAKPMRKAGDEQWVLLPENGTNVIRAGVYYLAAVSEGQNPLNDYSIGTETGSWTIESLGTVTGSDLGTVGETDLVQADTLAAGALRTYRFDVPAGVVSVEVRLEGKTGNPLVATIAGEGLPSVRTAPPSWSGDPIYGNWGGQLPTLYDRNICTLVNPTAGTYSVSVFADSMGWPGYEWFDAAFTVRVRCPEPIEMNFTDLLNTNGMSNIVSGAMADGQRVFHRVVVPERVGDRPVVGWMLGVAQTKGSAQARVRKGALPEDSAPGTSSFMGAASLVTPPYLTPGVWYVEVLATGITEYTLTSREFVTERPAWNMPLAGEPTTTPGLTAPEFGDTGTDTNGIALPGDRGIDLANGAFHYYAVNVPSNDVLLIRTMLEAISGNPDLYIRAGCPPTLNHNAEGNPGALFERKNTGTGTEYGNWVPHDGRYENRLAGGVWYFAVRAAGNANCRYRLHVSSGQVADLALDGGAVSDQLLAGGDWRYYRVLVPTNAPAQWKVTLGQQMGDVVLHVRDTSPPGNNQEQRNWWETSYSDWLCDRKNDGPYASYDAAGTYTFDVPPMRPGHTYYLGVRAVSDALFSLSSSVAGGVYGSPIVLPFGDGFTSAVLPAQGAALYAVDVPSNATRWIHTSVHSSDVRVFIEQGTVPYPDDRADWTSAGDANSRLAVDLQNPGEWPWVPGHRFYMLATNTSFVDQPLDITVAGPDLIPTGLTWTNDAVAGRTHALVLAVSNAGHNAAMPAWCDEVYLSSNAVWDAEDAYLGGWWRNEEVSAGGVYAWTNEVSLPAWPAGHYYFIVKTDSGNSLFESDESNNVMAVAVTLTTPDLEPTRLTWEGETIANRSLTLVGTVTNLGSGSAHPYWYDKVYLSSNATWDAEDAHLCSSRQDEVVLAGGSYVWTNVVSLPAWPAGSYYFVVKADGDEQLFEADESNNVMAVAVTLTAPDLAPTNLVWEGETIANRSLTLVGTVTNLGNGTASPWWYDEVYLSSNAEWDAEDVYLGGGWHGEEVAVGGVYAWTNAVSLPAWPAGSYYFIVKTDSQGQLFENDESNNVMAFAVTLTVPDLAPTNLVWEGEAMANRSLTLVGTVTNLGGGTAGPWWHDEVYLSSNAEWDAEDVYLCGSSHDGDVSAGGVYAWTNEVGLPAWPAGSYYFVVKADSGKSLYEADESNNVMAVAVTLTTPDLEPTRLTWEGEAIASRSLTLVGTVTNLGSGSAHPYWYDKVYLSSNATWDAEDVNLSYSRQDEIVLAGGSYVWTNMVSLPAWPAGRYYFIVKADGDDHLFENGESNNVMAVAVTLTAPDLAPTNLVWEGEAIANRPLTLVGTVTNLGDGAASPWWYDEVFLSSNAEWDAEDVSLGGRWCSDEVSADGAYMWTNAVVLPAWPAGSYYFIVKADSYGQLFEDDESNNVMAFPVSLTTPDLRVAALSFVMAEATERSVPLVCVVTNQGSGGAEGGWYDDVYLSTNATLDPEDTVLLRAYVNSPVAAGSAYTWTNTVTLPGWVDGLCYLIVVADGDDWVFESSDENNSDLVDLTVPLVYTLTVESDHGGTAPGTVTVPRGTVVEQWVTNSPVVDGGVQYVCSAASVVGADFVQIDPTHTRTLLTNNATLIWLWQTNYWLGAATSGVGTIVGDQGWHPAGSTVPLRAEPGVYWTFGAWSGDTDGCEVASNAIDVAMTQSREIVASFIADATEQGTPHWWLARYGWSNGFETVEALDPDGDGMTTWEEYMADTDPTNEYAVLAVSGVERIGDTFRVRWQGGVQAWQYLEMRRDLTDPGEEWVPVYTGEPPTPPTNSVTGPAPDGDVFYRIRVTRP